MITPIDIVDMDFHKEVPVTDLLVATKATHILYRSDFRDDTMFDSILEAHGIEDFDAVDSITIRSTVECVEGE